MKREVSVVIERDFEGYYVASVPELHGCHNQGRSLDKPRRLLFDLYQQKIRKPRGSSNQFPIVPEAGAKLNVGLIFCCEIHRYVRPVLGTNNANRFLVAS